MSSNHHIQRSKVQWAAPAVKLDKAKNGMWTASVIVDGAVPVYLHSRYDPSAEAERFAAAQLSSLGEIVPEFMVIYGAGCGHHVTALLKMTENMKIKLEVWEANVSAFLNMEENGVYDSLLDESRLTFVVADDMKVFADRVQAWEEDGVHVVIHEPSLRAVPDPLEPLKRVLQDYQVLHNSVIAQRELLQHNYDQNTRIEWSSLSAFEGLPSVPAILISAGPSLARSLPSLQAAAEHSLLGSVGTAASVLLQHGIRPDFVVMSDPKPAMLDQLKNWEKLGIPLFFLCTVYDEVAERHQGPKFIVFQEGYGAAEQLASQRNESLARTGGSVSTLLFSICRLLGLGPLCLVGQDLAYTDNQTHVEGTSQHQKWEQQGQGDRVLAFDGKGTVIAPRNLLLYKKWFEEQARGSDETYYNATEGGAYIDGFAHLALTAFIDKVNAIDIAKARETFHRLALAATMN